MIQMTRRINNMNSTCINEILKNENLSIEEKEKMINAHYKQEDKDKENKEKGYFDSPAFEYDKKRIYEECESEYKEIWNKLETESKASLFSAYIYDFLVNNINDDESSTILKFCKTVENEIRKKFLLSLFQNVILVMLTLITLLIRFLKVA